MSVDLYVADTRARRDLERIRVAHVELEQALAGGDIAAAERAADRWALARHDFRRSMRQRRVLRSRGERMPASAEPTALNVREEAARARLVEARRVTRRFNRWRVSTRVVRGLVGAARMVRPLVRPRARRRPAFAVAAAGRRGPPSESSDDPDLDAADAAGFLVGAES